MQFNLSIETRLDAINAIIGAMGLAPVPSEDFYNLDSARAALCLDNASRTIQNNKGRGWWFNSEANWQLTPDPVNGFITVPNTAVAVMMQRYPITYYSEWTGHIGRKMALRGRRLYDTLLHSFDMRPNVNANGVVQLAIITQLQFDDLPQSAKDAVTLAATTQFLANNEMEVNRLKVAQENATMRYYELEAENMSQVRSNAFTANRTMMQFIAVGGGYNNR